MNRTVLVIAILVLSSVGLQIISPMILGGSVDCRYTDFLPWPPSKCAEESRLMLVDSLQLISVALIGACVLVSILIFIRKWKPKKVEIFPKLND